MTTDAVIKCTLSRSRMLLLTAATWPLKPPTALHAGLEAAGSRMMADPFDNNNICLVMYSVTVQSEAHLG